MNSTHMKSKLGKEKQCKGSEAPNKRRRNKWDERRHYMYMGEQRCQSKPKATLGYYLLTLGSLSDRKEEVGKQG